MIYPQELVDLVEKMDDLYWEENPDGGSHEDFAEWAEQRFCNDHFGALQFATGIGCWRCALEKILNDVEEGATIT